MIKNKGSENLRNQMVLDNDRNPQLETYFMKQALKIAKEALAIGEVPVGCVIVLRKDLEPEQNECKLDTHIQNALEMTAESVHDEQITRNNEKEEKEGLDLTEHYISSAQVIISHGANQVNATRDATRHAECIAIDRMLTGGLVSDKVRLPQNVFLRKMKKNSDVSSYSNDKNDNDHHDKWINVPSEPNHWKNSYGWGNGRLYKRDVLKNCDLYVTCEPCIMVS